MNVPNTVLREATAADVPAMFHVRTSVEENHLSVSQLAQLGITPQSLVTWLNEGIAGWVAEEGGQVVGFSLADSRNASIFALFVLPTHEHRGHGTRLLAAAVGWLRERSSGTISLNTGIHSSAVSFYERRGWRKTQVLPSREVHMVLLPE
jgi:GNAT superfamily N-acetyltransferase